MRFNSEITQQRGRFFWYWSNRRDREERATNALWLWWLHVQQLLALLDWSEAPPQVQLFASMLGEAVATPEGIDVLAVVPDDSGWFADQFDRISRRAHYWARKRVNSGRTGFDTGRKGYVDSAAPEDAGRRLKADQSTARSPVAEVPLVVGEGIPDSSMRKARRGFRPIDDWSVLDKHGRDWRALPASGLWSAMRGGRTALVAAPITFDDVVESAPESLAPATYERPAQPDRTEAALLAGWHDREVGCQREPVAMRPVRIVKNGKRREVHPAPLMMPVYDVYHVETLHQLDGSAETFVDYVQRDVPGTRVDWSDWTKTPVLVGSKPAARVYFDEYVETLAR